MLKFVHVVLKLGDANVQIAVTTTELVDELFFLRGILEGYVVGEFEHAAQIGGLHGDHLVAGSVLFHKVGEHFRVV